MIMLAKLNVDLYSVCIIYLSPTYPDYKLHMEQMTKLKMNFIGLHTYNPEPTVWVGLT